jgi:hypothetical protein
LDILRKNFVRNRACCRFTAHTTNSVDSQPKHTILRTSLPAAPDRFLRNCGRKLLSLNGLRVSEGGTVDR